MTKTPSMTTLAKRYLDYRRSLGYQLKIEGQLLLQFAQYADQSGHRGPLTSELAIAWARQPSNAARLYWARRLEIVRCFARYLAVFDRSTEIPPAGIFGKAHRRTRPYIYSTQELAALLSAAGRIGSAIGLRSKTYVTLFGLLACTGLRICEALRLNCADVDLKQGILAIRHSKYRKSRLVPLHASARRALFKYAETRNVHHPQAASLAFFLSEGGRPLPYSTVRSTFRGLCRKAGLVQKPGERAPRIHDLRHTFACHRLLQWYCQGVDVEHLVPALSTYLGHAKVTDTYWYLTGFPQLLRIAAARFEGFASAPGGGQR
jgi:integrase